MAGTCGQQAMRIGRRANGWGKAMMATLGFQHLPAPPLPESQPQPAPPTMLPPPDVPMYPSRPARQAHRLRRDGVMSKAMKGMTRNGMMSGLRLSLVFSLSLVLEMYCSMRSLCSSCCDQAYETEDPAWNAQNEWWEEAGFWCLFVRCSMWPSLHDLFCWARQEAAAGDGGRLTRDPEPRWRWSHVE